MSPAGTITQTTLGMAISEHIDAINAGDTDRTVATFAEDAYVNDNRRIFVGVDAIRRWVAKEMVGDKVTIEVREVLDHYGDTMLRVAYDGTFDTNHPVRPASDRRGGWPRVGLDRRGWLLAEKRSEPALRRFAAPPRGWALVRTGLTDQAGGHGCGGDGKRCA